MISFWRQLRFLLHKGILIKQRQKIWLLAEILTPLVLFVIIALVRTRDFTVDGLQCHFDSKGFPSAGLLPFTQSFLCSITNKCNQGPTNGDDGQYIGNTTKQSDLIRSFRLMTDQLAIIGEDPEMFDDFIELAIELLKQLSDGVEHDQLAITLKKLFTRSTNITQLFIGTIPAKALPTLETSEVTLLGLFEIANYLDEASNMSPVEQLFVAFSSVDFLCENFTKYFRNPTGESFDPLVLESLCDVTLSDFVAFDRENFQKHFLVSGSYFQPLIELVDIWTSFDPNSDEEIVNRFFCGNDPTDADASSNIPPSKKVETKMSKMNERIMRFVSSVTPGSSSEENVTQCSGVALRKEELNCTFMDVNAKRLLRPVYAGYILVSPDTPLVRKVVEKLEYPLKQYTLIMEQLKQVGEAAPTFQDSLHNSELGKAITKLAKDLATRGLITPEQEHRIEELVGPSSNNATIGTLFHDFTHTLTNFTQCFAADKFRMMPNESTLETAAVCLQNHDQYFTGIVFPDVSPGATEFNDTVVYKIRHAQIIVDGTDSVADSNRNFHPRNNPFQDLKYLTFGWSFLQERIDRILIDMKVKEPVSLGVYSQQEPYPCVTEDKFNVTLFLALFVILSWMIPCALLVKNIVYEKEQRLKELMRIMGLGDMIHFISWGLLSLVLNVISLVIISLILKFGNIMPHIDLSLLIVFLLLYSLSSISLAILVSTFFSNANLATAATALGYFFFFFPYQLSRKTKSETFAKFTLILPQTTLGYGFELLSVANSYEWGRWSDVRKLKDLTPYNVSMTECLIAFPLQIVGFCIVAWYISAIFPGVYGVGLPWYFPFTIRYWFRKNGKVSTIEREPSDSFESIHENESIEDEPKDAQLSVKISKLSKVYANKTKALDGLNLRLYEGQITGLLGHNGAGKTTTMSLLCGLFRPSSGTATVYGRDLKTDLRGVRDVLGICPQHNVLFSHLTVSEQLRFFAALKGVADCDLESEVQQALESVNLTEKRNALAGTLSGGMKRRLSIGIALIGGSKLVILDEPTAGVDVNARKDIWRLLIKNKRDRTILLSTHHMDEADVLSDRIAILSEGRLKTLGSSVFLKKKYGNCYKLTLLKLRPGLSCLPPSCDWEGVRCNYIEETDQESVYSIPLDTDSEALEAFFRRLDDNMKELNCQSYGISAPSLQQIFVSLAPQKDLVLRKDGPGPIQQFFTRICGRKPAEDRDVLVIGPDGNDTISTGMPISEKPWDDSEVPLLGEGASVTFYHITALLIAKLLYTSRSMLTLTFQVLLPILLLLTSELYSKYVNSSKTYGRWETMISAPPLILSTALFGDGPESYMSIYGNESHHSNSLVNTMMEAPGVGIRCLDYAESSSPTVKSLVSRMFYEHHRSIFMPRDLASETFNMACYTSDDNVNITFAHNSNEIPYNVNETCGCDKEKGGWTCEQEDYPWDELPYFVSANTTDTIYDLSSRNLSQFRMVTRFATNLKTMHNILGGWSFGHQNVHAKDEIGIEKEKLGLREVVKEVERFGEAFHINSTWWRGNWTVIKDPFVENVSISDTMSDILENMDTEENIKVWFNNKIWPSLPIYYNSMSNAILRALAAREPALANRVSDLGIITFNHPMNRTAEETIDTGQLVRTLTFRIVLLLLVYSVLPAGFAVFLVNDRESHHLHLQLVSGLKKKTYWIVEYSYDVFILLVASTIILIMYWIVGVPEMTRNFGTSISFLLVFFLYGCNCILIVFLLQRAFSIPALAFVSISIGCFFVGVVTVMTVIMIEGLLEDDESLETAYRWTSNVFLVILPQFNFGMAIYRGTYVYQVYKMAQLYLISVNRRDMIPKIPMPSLLEWDIMGMHLLVICLQSIVVLAAFVLTEMGSLGWFRRWEKRRAQEVIEQHLDKVVDLDVLEERTKVEKTVESDETAGLVVHQLAKCFGSFAAVKGISFSVEEGECFGLLGLNGAGKTTTFSMMTGKERIGYGSVSIHSHKVERSSSKGFKYLGFCPQFDALNMKLTAKENLYFYARIRGVLSHSIERVVSSMLRSLHLKPYSDTLTSELSGGNRRKLSVAIALISQPPVIMLDEPSAGMDPGSQQFLWSVITRLRKAGRAVVLTSHSMEECEALCTRIAIMDKGQIRCIGSKQRLKDKYGEGYTLMLKTSNAEAAQRAVDFVMQRVEGAKADAIHCSTAFVHIAPEGNTIASILSVVNKLKVHDSVEDFALSQTTLDDIFLALSTNSSTATEAATATAVSDTSVATSTPLC